jgi:hypothetical protein
VSIFLLREDNDADYTHVVKIDNYVFEEEPPLRPNFPVAAPPSPRPHGRKISPDIHITPAGRPDYLLSPPPPQEDGFLFVPARSSRAGRQRRQETLPPSPRPLPTTPGRPSCPIPNISRCPWANNLSTQPSPTTPLTGSEAEDAAILFFLSSAPYLFSMTNENSSNDDNESQHPDTSDPSTDAAGSDQVRRPKVDAMTLDKTQANEIQDVATDVEFLEDIGLGLQAFIALLDGIDIQWVDD